MSSGGLISGGHPFRPFRKSERNDDDDDDAIRNAVPFSDLLVEGVCGSKAAIGCLHNMQQSI